MIHLDTSALISLPAWAREGHPIIQRIAAGEPAAVSTVVWYEFVTGPVEAHEVRLALGIIAQRIVAVERRDAELAARLLNQAGRKRGLKTDALIAASAIHADPDFVTLNVDDFAPFRGAGLRLVAP